MKKVYKNDNFKNYQKKRENAELKRKQLLNKKTYVKKNFYRAEVEKFKKLTPPKNFSLISNTNETLVFFENFSSYIKKNYNSFNIDLKKIDNLTIEVLLYFISLHKMYKENNIKFNIRIKAPKLAKLKYIMTQSGISKYFRATVDIEQDEESIYPIQDKQSNEKNNIEDETTCKNAVEFVKKFKNITPSQRHIIFNSLSEMMLNTDNHAYDENSPLPNWYIFAAEVEKGIAFHFFDNGRGIINTARKNIKERLFNKFDVSINLAQESILKAVLNGEYRSQTGLPNRNKGIPEIKEFLTNDIVAYPIIITNRIKYCIDNDRNIVIEKLNYNFQGTLFIWVIKKD